MSDDTGRTENDRTRRMSPSDLPTPEGESDATRQIDPAQDTRHLPAIPLRSASAPPPARVPSALLSARPPTQQQMQPPPRTVPPEHVRRQLERREARRQNAFYLPWWSLLLTLIGVLSCAGLIVLGVIALGGNPAPPSAPMIVVNTVVPTERPASLPPSPVAATIPAAESTETQNPAVNFSLVGPTLEPVRLSATPGVIDIGARVIVVDVGDQELNVRDAPGVSGTSITFRAPEGVAFRIVGGPQQADGLTWWQIALEDNPSRVGWAASNYLEYQAPEQ
jgi:hypothetical protein